MDAQYTEQCSDATPSGEFHQKVIEGITFAMKIMADVRRGKLQELVDESNLTAVANRLKKPIRQINDMLAGRKTFGDKVARQMEQEGNLPPYYFDGLTQPRQSEPVLKGDPNFVAIRRVDFKISAGISGYAVDYLNGDRAPIFFRKDWLEKKKLNPNKLYAIPVRGESMETSLFEGDLVVINGDETNPIDGEVYAVNYEGELVIKRMHREAGLWYLASDNTDKRRFPNKVCQENCFIIGRIIYKQSERI